MQKTLLKLYANGDLESVGVPLYQYLNLINFSNTKFGSLNSSGLFDNSPSKAMELGTKVSDFIKIEPKKKYNFKGFWDVQKVININGRWCWVILYSYDNDLKLLRKEAEINKDITSEATVNFTSHDRATFLRCAVSHVNHYAAKGEITSSDDPEPNAYRFNENYIKLPSVISYSKNDYDYMPDWAIENNAPFNFLEKGLIIKGRVL